MKLSTQNYWENTESYAGYCSSCDEITQFSGVEPDAEDYPCPECQENTLRGIEQALMMGEIEIED